MILFGFEIKLPQIFCREKRGTERVRTRESLYVDYFSPELGKRGTGEGKDISETGVRFVSADQFCRGVILELSVRIPAGIAQKDILSVKAKVVRSYRIFRQKRYRVACAFLDLDEPTRKDLQTFVAWLKYQKDHYLFFRWGEKGDKE